MLFDLHEIILNTFIQLYLIKLFSVFGSESGENDDSGICDGWVGQNIHNWKRGNQQNIHNRQRKRWTE